MNPVSNVLVWVMVVAVLLVCGVLIVPLILGGIAGMGILKLMQFLSDLVNRYDRPV